MLKNAKSSYYNILKYILGFVYRLFFIYFLSGPSYPPSRASLFELHNVGGCRPRWVAQSQSLFVPYAADHDGVSAIGLCYCFNCI